MPTSATGTNRGFTLVEMLVVLVIISLLSSVVVLTLPTGGGSLRDDARALAAQLKLASQESIIRGAATGVVISPEGYAFYRLQAGKWTAFTGERVFQPRTWRKGVIADVARTANIAPRAPGEEKAVLPSLVFDPTGVTAPFAVSLAEKDERFEIVTNAKGEVLVRDMP